MRSALRTYFGDGQQVSLKLELDKLHLLRSAWPADGAHVVLLHCEQNVEALLDHIRWLLRRELIPAVLVMGNTTAMVYRKLVDVGVTGFLSMNVDEAEVLNAIMIVAAGGMNDNAAMKAAFRTAPSGRSTGRTLPKELTDKQLEVMRLLGDPTELSYKVMAGRMGISINTLKQHVKALFRIFGKHSRSGLVAKAIAEKYIDPHP
ncbi:MAG: response regulator transcription factor [Flavobacteriales bacterium]